MTTGIWDRATRSADSSYVWDAPRCTPPRPPVGKTLMPARCARKAVAATVVPPLAPRAIATGRSRIEHLIALSSRLSSRSSSVLSPTVTRPCSTPTVAGVTPCPRRTSSAATATSRFRGRGNPWVMIVDSKATTGRPCASASATSCDTYGSMSSPPRSSFHQGGLGIPRLSSDARALAVLDQTRRHPGTGGGDRRARLAHALLEYGPTDGPVDLVLIHGFRGDHHGLE